MTPYKIRVATAFIVCVLVTSLGGQTSQQLAAKYPLVSAYEVRPGILMTTKSASDGQVCEMVVESRHYRPPNNVDLGSTIPSNLSEELINELVPTAERGKPTKSRWLSSDVGGGVIHTSQEYENVSIELYGSSCTVVELSQKKRHQCDTVGDEVVVIRWKHRACVAPTSTVATH